MANYPLTHSRGFVLESADSVRFGPEYTADEVERNRQILFGELLCGLLMGEPVWTSAVFAFDSQGMVEALGAISRAFKRKPDCEQFLPFIISVYPQDKDPWTGQTRAWQTPAEFFLRCYAHRLKNHNFQLSATSELHRDESRREALAESLRIAAEDGREPALTSIRGDAEEKHFRDIFAIDRYLRSWLGRNSSTGFAQYCEKADGADMPIQKIRDGWQQRYRAALDAQQLEITKLRFFLQNAYQLREAVESDDSGFRSAAAALHEVLELPLNASCFANRSAFRTQLKNQGLREDSDVFRILIELVDGHYIRTQYTELTYTAREVTSPASKSAASQIGEKWTALTLRACLSSSSSIRPWQFINRIQAVPSKNPVSLDLDGIAQRFADFMSHPDRRSELSEYHRLLAFARMSQEVDGVASDSAKRQFDALQSHVTRCVDKINEHMDETGTQFHFNVNDARTCAGSLTLTFSGVRSTGQCTGPREDAKIDPLPVTADTDESQGSNNCFTGA